MTMTTQLLNFTRLCIWIGLGNCHYSVERSSTEIKMFEKAIRERHPDSRTQGQQYIYITWAEPFISDLHPDVPPCTHLRVIIR